MAQTSELRCVASGRRRTAASPRGPGSRPLLSYTADFPLGAQERLLELRRAKFEEERMHETEEQLQQELADEARMKIIVDERARILAAHAKNLDIKHLPKGVLATEADFAIFNRK